MHITYTVQKHNSVVNDGKLALSPCAEWFQIAVLSLLRFFPPLLTTTT